METKKDIRKKIFAKRKEYTDEQIQEMSQRVCDNLVALDEFQKATRLYIYADYNHEVCTGEMIKAAWKADKKVAVPKVEGKDMIFYQLDDFTQLEPGYFGIPEPSRGDVVQWEDALMIMPGVAFNNKKERVGYGGGFYDRFLEAHPINTVAVAFEFQMVGDIPTEPTDILPGMIVTENQIYR